WTWRQYRGGPPGPRPDGADGGRWEVTNSVGYETDAGADPPRARLDYRLTDSAEQLAYAVPLATTRPPRGGPRWWFRCPLAVDGQRCGRRVRKLYLPPGGRYFGCRHCYGLTYTSCQQCHRWDSLYRVIARNLGTDPRVVRRHLAQYEKHQRRAARHP